MGYQEGIETIDTLITSLEYTKQCLENGNILDNQLYGNFELLSLVYNSIIELYGEDSLEDFQNYYISEVLKTIQLRISAKAITLSVEKEDGIAMIKGSIYYQGKNIDVFYINPYFKTILLIKNELDDNMETKLKKLYEEEESIYNEIENLQLAKTNPIYYAKDDTVLLAKMTLQRNKYAKIIQDEIHQKEQELLMIKEEIANTEIDKKSNTDNYTKLYLYRDRYLERLKNVFHFNIIKEETLDEYKNQTTDINMFSIERS